MVRSLATVLLLLCQSQQHGTSVSDMPGPRQANIEGTLGLAAQNLHTQELCLRCERVHSTIRPAENAPLQTSGIWENDLIIPCYAVYAMSLQTPNDSCIVHSILHGSRPKKAPAGRLETIGLRGRQTAPCQDSRTHRHGDTWKQSLGRARVANVFHHKSSSWAAVVVRVVQCDLLGPMAMTLAAWLHTEWQLEVPAFAPASTMVNRSEPQPPGLGEDRIAKIS